VACPNKVHSIAVGLGGNSQAQVINGTFIDNGIDSLLLASGNSSVSLKGTHIRGGRGGIIAGELRWTPEEPHTPGASLSQQILVMLLSYQEACALPNHEAMPSATCHTASKLSPN
jgi:hypothetical protein